MASSPSVVNFYFQEAPLHPDHSVTRPTAHTPASETISDADLQPYVEEISGLAAGLTCMRPTHFHVNCKNKTLNLELVLPPFTYIMPYTAKLLQQHN